MIKDISSIKPLKRGEGVGRRRLDGRVIFKDGAIYNVGS